MTNAIIKSEEWANIWTVACEKGGYLCACTEKEADITTDILVEVTEIKKDWCWCKGVFKSGQNLQVQVIRWGLTVEEAAKPVGTDEWDDVWVKLGQLGIASGYDVEVLEKAVAAKKALQKANREYRKTLLSLGAVRKDDGSWENPEEWLEIPGMPKVMFKPCESDF